MNLTATQKLIISILVIVVLAIAAILLLIVPQISNLSRLSGEIDQANADYEAASLVLERRQEAKARAASTETELLRLSNEVPEAPELPALIIELQNAANTSGLDFASITPGLPTAAEEAEWLSIPINMTVEGSWRDYVDYLGRLRKIVRQVRIVSFNVVHVPPEECGDDGKIAASISVEAYTMPSEVSGGGGAEVPPDVPAE